MKSLRKLFSATALIFAAACLILASCTKEGPQGPPGPTGPTGANGQDGKDATENCKQCHAKAIVDAIAVEFELSKHSWGEAAFEEAGNTTCGPCHEHKAYTYVCANNTPATFVFNETTKRWVNSYTVPPSEAIGDITCYTCHNSLHTTYATADLALTTTAPVPMTMWGGAKTIDLPADGGMSHLCVKCHQPRPLTATNTYDPSTRLINYDSLKNFPAVTFYDTTAGVKNVNIRPSYRMHVHYGAVGAVVAGMGAIEFTGSRTYANSIHTTVASCQDCHMASPMTGVAGGHAFNMRNGIESALGSSTSWNFNGCNVAECHGSNPIDANSSYFKDVRAEIKTLLNALADKINAAGAGNDLLHSESDPTSNLWAGITTGNYDGYMDIYDASANPTGFWRNPAGPNSEPNISKPKFPKLLNVQMGAIINFQFCLREYSLGIHNTKYVKALLTNTVEAMTAQGL
jgi:hypothetical protein